MTITKDTLIAVAVVFLLAVAALSFANSTEGMMEPLEMAKLGLHRMPDGEWMQAPKTNPASAGGGHSEHGVANDDTSYLERPKARPEHGPGHE